MYNGIVVTLDDASIQFTTDFVNLILRQFVMGVAQAQIAAQQNIPPQATSEVIPLEKPKSSLIIEA